ncbi:YcjF family protein [Thermodesulfobacteriota bacterium]
MKTEAMETTETTMAEVSEAELNRLIKNHVWASIGIGLVPVPMLDMVALTGVQLNLVRKIAAAYNIPFLKDKMKNILGSLLGGVIPSTVGPPLATSISKAIPIFGQTFGVITMPTIAGASTYAVGKVFVQHFASGGTFLTFDPEKVMGYYAEMFEEGKKTAKQAASDVKNDKPEREKDKKEATEKKKSE